MLNGFLTDYKHLAANTVTETDFHLAKDRRPSAAFDIQLFVYSGHRHVHYSDQTSNFVPDSCDGNSGDNGSELYELIGAI